MGWKRVYKLQVGSFATRRTEMKSETRGGEMSRDLRRHASAFVRRFDPCSLAPRGGLTSSAAPVGCCGVQPAPHTHTHQHTHTHKHWHFNISSIRSPKCWVNELFPLSNPLPVFCCWQFAYIMRGVCVCVCGVCVQTHTRARKHTHAHTQTLA